MREILDRWRIDDEWWRSEISRMYYHVVLQSGQILTLFHDLIPPHPSLSPPGGEDKGEGSGWFVQTSGTSLRQPEPIQVLAPAAPAAASEAAKAPLRRIG